MTRKNNSCVCVCVFTTAERRGGTGLTCRFSDRLPKGGLRLSDESQRLSDSSGGDS